ncbi:MAG: hypothetical protein WCA46_14855 [Actinocatenispora sp.]
MSSYEPPTYPEQQSPRPAGAPPVTIRWASIGIFVLAALNLLSVIASVTGRTEIVDTLQDQSHMNQTNANLVATITVAVSVVFAIAFAVLYVWLGVKTNAGRNWARITVTVILGLAVVGTLATLSQPGSGFSSLMSILKVVVEIAVLALIWVPAASRAYFTPGTPAPVA